jgi:hypothetical protein
MSQLDNGASELAALAGSMVEAGNPIEADAILRQATRQGPHTVLAELALLTDAERSVLLTPRPSEVGDMTNNVHSSVYF